MSKAAGGRRLAGGSEPNLKELAPQNVRAIAPYVPGKPISETARELNKREEDILKMASNENPIGPSPMAIAAIRNALEVLHYYPDGSGYELKKLLAGRVGLAQENFILGNGSNDVLELVARAFLTRDDSAIYAKHAFMVYPLAVQAIGAKAIEVAARNYGNDLEAMARAVRADTKIVFVANPNNPTGTFTPWEDLRRFLERIAPNVLVVIDEAYGEYLPDALASPTAKWLGAHPNLVVARTLSKAYGLAGLRVGYAFAHRDVAELMNRVRQPFNVNHLAMVAACAALEDREFITTCRDVNARGLVQLEKGFKELGLEYIPSRGNFITVRVGDAARIYEALLHDGIIVRPVAGYGMPEHLRVTVDLPENNDRFLAALKRALGR
jgi:histidinol-phosphate aminotransferase